MEKIILQKAWDACEKSISKGEKLIELGNKCLAICRSGGSRIAAQKKYIEGGKYWEEGDKIVDNAINLYLEKAEDFFDEIMIMWGTGEIISEGERTVIPLSEVL